MLFFFGFGSQYHGWNFFSPAFTYRQHSHSTGTQSFAEVVVGLLRGVGEGNLKVWFDFFVAKGISHKLRYNRPPEFSRQMAGVARLPLPCARGRDIIPLPLVFVCELAVSRSGYRGARKERHLLT